MERLLQESNGVMQGGFVAVFGFICSGGEGALKISQVPHFSPRINNNKRQDKSRRLLNIHCRVRLNRVLIKIAQRK